MNDKFEKFKPGTLFTITVLVLLIPLAYYIFFWVPEREDALSSRYLRLIAGMSDQFETKGRNIKTVIESETNNILKSLKGNRDEQDKISDELNYLETKGQLDTDCQEILKNQELKDNWFFTYLIFSVKRSLKRIPDLDVKCFKVGEWDKTLKYDPAEIECNLDMTYNRRSDILELLIIFNTAGKDLPYQIRAGMKIPDFIGKIFKGEEFEEVFLLNEDKKTIHRWGRVDDAGTKSSLKIFDFAPLVSAAADTPVKKESSSKDKTGGNAKDKAGNKKKGGASGTFSRVLNINAAGSDYKLFLQPIPLTFVNSADKNWYVGGLLPAKTFALRSRKISLNAVIMFLFIIFLILVGYPTVKLLLTDAADRLKMRDVFLVILSLSIGVPMVIYLLLSTAYYFTDHNITLKLERISDQIHGNFTDEIERAYEQLTILVNDKNDVMKRKTGEPGKKDRKKGKKILDAYSDEELKYPYFDMAFIMNKKGKQIYKGVVNEDNISFNDVSSREYFKRIRDQEYWFTPSEKPMMLEPVYSKSTGRYEINLAIPLHNSNSEDVFAAGMSFRPLSVINPVLPYGYAFAIIDHKGKVLLHSDSRLNSYENFFTESTAKGTLKAAIFARTGCRGKITYHGERWDLYSRPIRNIPWDIIVLKNRDIGSVQGLATLLIALIDNVIYIFFLGLLLFFFDLYILLREKMSGKDAGRQPIKFRLLWPNETLRYRYAFLALLNLFVFGILLLHLLTSGNQPAYFLITPFIVSIFIFSIMMKSVYYEDNPAVSQRFTRFSYLFPAIILPLLALVFIYLVEKRVFLSFSVSNSIVLIPVICYLIALFIPEEIAKKWLKCKIFTRNSYTLFLYSYLVLVIVYPGIYMVRTTIHDITKVATKHDQLILARDYTGWEKRVKKDYPGRANFLKKDEMDVTKDEPFKNPWTYTFKSVTLKTDVDGYIESARKVNSFFSLPVLNKFIEKTEQTRDVFLKIEDSINPAFFTVKIMKFLNNMMPVNLHYVEGIMSILPEDTKKKQQKRPLMWIDKPGSKKISFKYNEKPKRAKPIYIESSITKIKRNRNEIIIMVVCIFFIVFFVTIILYAVVRFIIKIVFPPPAEISSHKKTLFFSSGKAKPGKFLVLGKGAIQDVTKGYSSQKKSSRKNSIDCKDIEALKTFDESSLPAGSYVYITHFDYGMHDAEKNTAKLRLLERLVFSSDVNITVFSNFEPLGYFTLAKPVAKDKKDKKNKDKSEEKGNEKDILGRWRRILNHFEYRYTKKAAGSQIEAPAGLNGGLKKFVEDECENPDYMEHVKNQIFDEFEGMKSENISLPMLKDRVYQLAKPVYDQIWRTSTADEKMVLVQLAQEGLLNFKNKTPVRHLLSRGLIQYPPIRFINKTFKEYIRSVDDLDKILDQENKEEDKRWKRFKRPFFYLVTLAVLFLVITQPAVWKSWMVIIPAITGGVPTLIRFLDQFLGGQRYNLEE